jgi:iron complex outermembrane receptor protein
MAGAMAGVMAGVMVCAGASAATADAGASDTKTAAEGTGGLEEVIVTARRRSEDVQQVPISISDLSAQDLEMRNITTSEGLNHAIINFAPAPSSFFGLEQASFRIRGLPNVGVYIDGVAHQEEFGFLGSLLEMDRIEVLRGPQGTLFGKNSLAGAVQYVTKAPSDSFGVKLSTTVGDYHRFDVSGSADIPLAPTLLTKLSIAKVTRDGYLRSTTVNQDFGSQNDTIARADVLWKPTDSFNWRFIVEQDNIGTNGNATTLWGLSFSCAPIPSAGGNPGAACPYVGASTHGAPQLAISPKSLYGISQQWLTASNYNGPELYTDATNYTTIINYAFNDHWSVKGIGSYRNLQSENFEDFASIGVDMFEGENTNVIDETTGEAQLLFNNDWLTGTTGIYYYKDYRRYRRNNWFSNELDLDVNPADNAAANAAFGLPPGTIAHFGAANPDQLTYYNIHGIAGYSEWTWKATDKLSLTAGVRYNRDTTVDTAYVPANPIPAICCVPSTSFATAGLLGPPVDAVFTNTAPRVVLQYQWTPTVMTYAQYSEGFNQGGGTQTGQGAAERIAPFAPETLKNYEVGIRSETFDHTLRLNASVFYMQYENVQVTEDIDFNEVTANAGKGQSEGVELEGTWVATKAFSVAWGLGYLDSKLTEVPAGSGILVGAPLPFAPKYSATLALQYDTPLPNDATLTLRADEGYTTWVNTGVDASSVYIPGYGLLGARVIYRPNDAKWDAQLYGTNLLDTYYRLNGYNIPPLGDFNSGAVGLPRMWGLTFNFKFQ